MQAEIITYLKTTFTKHLLFIALVAVVILGGRAWLAEHDARMAKDGEVKAAAATISSLQARQKAVTSAAAVQVVRLRSEAATVKTAPQAVAALGSVEVESHPLDATLDAVDDTKADVSAVPLYQTLNECRQTDINFGACSQKLALQMDIDDAKDKEIVALKKRPSFLARAADVAEKVGIGVVIGAALVAAHR